MEGAGVEDLHNAALRLTNLKPGLIPRYIIESQYRYLEKLVVRGNKLTELDHEFCYSMPFLQHLDASSNEIVAVSANIAKFSHLTELILSYNKISDLSSNIYKC